MDLLERAGSSTVIVVGSGPAGVELATTVADKLGRKANIQLISTGEFYIACFKLHVHAWQSLNLSW